ncbi:MAG TPA: endonuclease/exonuclease/phosphatase family protein [Gaiellaceae bacterium]|nr:endonuclease/exonuclease/phosphatase family protein [Gaiellaceae bacterium]
MPLLVRTWNVFHGNAVPPERRAYLEEMVRLATADRPDILCLQEVPLWALGHLTAWSGMQAFGAVAARPRLGSVRLGKALTDLHHGLLRSALTGQANAILVAPSLRVREEWSSLLSEPGEGERRVCQAVRIEGLGVVGNFHATTRFAVAQFRRAVKLVELYAQPDAPIVLCGDGNVAPAAGGLYDELRERGFSPPAPGIDQVLVRGLPATLPSVWPEDRRRVDGRLLSDHAPVELHLG